jgi:hypothetical protein
MNSDRSEAVHQQPNIPIDYSHRIHSSHNLGVFILHGTQSTHLQIVRIHLLHHNTSGSTATVTDSGTAVLALLQLVQQGNNDPRSRAAKRVSKSNGTTARVDFRRVEVEDLYRNHVSMLCVLTSSQANSPSHSP